MSSLCKPSEEDVAAIDKLMSDGKRNYICNQPQIALDCFVELCEKLAKCYGQESDKCVEAYLYYGKTLLDIARLENGVLGHAIKEAPVFGSETEVDEKNEKDVNTEDEEDITPEKKDDIRNHVEHAMRGENLYNVSSTDDDQTEEEEEEDDTKVDAEDETNKSGGDSSKSEKEEKEATVTSEKDNTEEKTNAADSTTKEEKTTGVQMEVDDGIDCEGSDDDDTDDVSNMELSWEMFELTAVICKRQLSEEGHDHKAVKSTLAEAKYGLAQISLETERYEESVKDFNECLNLYKEVLDKNDRVIAEAHYNIALALSFDKKFSEAIERFECAVTILKARVADLEAKVKESEEEGAKKEKASAEMEEWKKEIGELNDLILLDMMTKIEDAHESKKLLDASIKTVKNAASEIFSSLSGAKSEFDAGFDEGFDAPLQGDAQVVHDCSDKIRSIKRKSDDETSDVSEKKAKQTTSIDQANITVSTEK